MASGILADLFRVRSVDDIVAEAEAAEARRQADDAVARATEARAAADQLSD